MEACNANGCSDDVCCAQRNTCLITGPKKANEDKSNAKCQFNEACFAAKRCKNHRPKT